MKKITQSLLLIVLAFAPIALTAQHTDLFPDINAEEASMVEWGLLGKFYVLYSQYNDPTTERSQGFLSVYSLNDTPIYSYPLPAGWTVSDMDIVADTTVVFVGYAPDRHCSFLGICSIDLSTYPYQMRPMTMHQFLPTYPHVGLDTVPEYEYHDFDHVTKVSGYMESGNLHVVMLGDKVNYSNMGLVDSEYPVVVHYKMGGTPTMGWYRNWASVVDDFVLTDNYVVVLSHMPTAESNTNYNIFASVLLKSWFDFNALYAKNRLPLPCFDELILTSPIWSTYVTGDRFAIAFESHGGTFFEEGMSLVEVQITQSNTPPSGVTAPSPYLSATLENRIHIADPSCYRPTIGFYYDPVYQKYLMAGRKDSDVSSRAIDYVTILNTDPVQTAIVRHYPYKTLQWMAKNTIGEYYLSAHEDSHLLMYRDVPTTNEQCVHMTTHTLETEVKNHTSQYWANGFTVEMVGTDTFVWNPEAIENNHETICD